MRATSTRRSANCKVHLDSDTVQRLIAGLPVSFDDPRQAVVYEVAFALVQPRPVSLGLYRKAKERIGDAGLVDVAALIGWFTTVMTLPAFDVPADADTTGLDQQRRGHPMTDPEARLGGRLALCDPDALTAQQRTLSEKVDATLGRFADEVGFRSKTRQGRFVGPFNPTLRSPDIGLSFLKLQMDEAKHTGFPERVRKVAILSVGSVWKASYELHSAAARKAGLSAPAVAALAAGVPCEDLTADEGAARRLTLALTADHAVDDALYTEGLQRFGEKGLVDLVMLAGCYHTVCGLLNMFAVPAPNDDHLGELG